MKGIIFFAVTLLSASLYAQNTSGVLLYEQAITTDFSQQGLPEEMIALLPRQQKWEKVLYFSPDAAIYENNEGAVHKKEASYQQENIAIQIETRQPDEKIFIDLEQQKVVALKEIMGRAFLISEPVSAYQWRFTGRQKKILDMSCMEAVTVKDKDSIIVWYTPEIPVSIGPESLGGLPGMILEAQFGRLMHIMAIRFEKEDAHLLRKIKEPVKGKKISAADFEKLAIQKREELQKQHGGKGNVIIMNSSSR